MATQSLEEMLQIAYSLKEDVHNRHEKLLNQIGNLEPKTIDFDTRIRILNFLNELEDDLNIGLKKISEIKKSGNEEICIVVQSDDEKNPYIYKTTIIEAYIYNEYSDIEHTRARLYPPKDKKHYKFLENSIQYKKKAIEVCPKKYPNEKYGLAYFYFDLGELYIEKHEPKLALDAFREFLELSNPKDKKWRLEASKYIEKLESLKIGQKRFTGSLKSLGCGGLIAIIFLIVGVTHLKDDLVPALLSILLSLIFGGVTALYFFLKRK